jgi:hypothetical protein
VWPRFIELCERRNLFTHTGGVVSSQYLKNCAEHKCDTSCATLGEPLGIDRKYFLQAIDTIYEVGLKLCFVFWRKFDKPSMNSADSKLNERCMELIRGEAYGLAESLLSFGCRVPGVKDEVRRMMIVNLANAVRLQERGSEAQKILDAEDWSATSAEFKVCIAAVYGRLEKVIELMERYGDQVKPQHYRNWPIFRGLNDKPEFIAAFERVFQEPFIVPQPPNVALLEGELGEAEIEPTITVH